MSRFLLAFIRFPIGKRPTTCSEAGRKGAAVRHAREREPILAKARQMLAEMGRPSDPRLGGC